MLSAKFSHRKQWVSCENIRKSNHVPAEGRAYGQAFSADIELEGVFAGEFFPRVRRVLLKTVTAHGGLEHSMAG
jgi:hypothetical protein